jgi:hypothetical protein
LIYVLSSLVRGLLFGRFTLTMDNEDYIRTPDDQFYDQLNGSPSPVRTDSELEKVLKLSAEMYSNQELNLDLDEVMLMSVQSYEQDQLLRELTIQEEERVKSEEKMRQEEAEKRQGRFAKLVPVFSRLWKIDSQNRDIYEFVLAFIESYAANDMDFIEVEPSFMDGLNKVSTSIRVDKALMEDLKTCFIN